MRTLVVGVVGERCASCRKPVAQREEVVMIFGRHLCQDCAKWAEIEP